MDSTLVLQVEGSALDQSPPAHCKKPLDHGSPGEKWCDKNDDDDENWLHIRLSCCWPCWPPLLLFSQTYGICSHLYTIYALFAEYLPYRRIDWTAQRDEKIHSYFCAHGYVCVRVDMRGTGDSEGYYYDEYEQQEQEDCCDVISWISRQDWCTGNVGN